MKTSMKKEPRQPTLINSSDGNETDESILDVLEILHEYQKRRVASSSSRLAATEAKKRAIVEKCNADCQQMKLEAAAYMYRASVKSSIQDLRASEIALDDTFAQVALLFGRRSKIVQSQTDLLSTFLSDVSSSRVDIVEANSADLSVHACKFKKTGRKVRRRAKHELEEGLETQRIATEAQAYIKHYKHLVTK